MYSVFIFQFYKFLARKNILQFNLNQYNNTSNPGLNKFLASLFYVLEYIIIIPLIVFFWFGILSLFLLVLSKSPSVEQILLVAAAIIAATRVTSYVSGTLSKDLAKMFPFTILAIFLVDPDFFSFDKLIDRINEIPSLLNHIFIFLVFIIGLEILMRLVYLVIQALQSSEAQPVVQS